MKFDDAILENSAKTAGAFCALLTIFAEAFIHFVNRNAEDHPAIRL